MVLTVNDTIVEPQFDTVPEEMQKLNNWVVWQAEPSNKVNADGEQILEKVLKRTTGRSASSTDKKTWTDFHNAYQSYVNQRFDGIGFVFEKHNDIIGLDLDGHIIDGEPVTKIAEYICEQTYVEISPSGTGAHAYFIGKMPAHFKHKHKDHEGELEIYNDTRFFTFTGSMIGQSDISRDQSIIDMLVETYFHRETPEPVESAPGTYNLETSEIKRKMFRNDKLKRLFEGETSDYLKDDSAADMALCNHLAFWTGKNRYQMDELFRQSGLMRDKWDEKRGETTYGFYTIDKAIAECKNVYKLSIDNPKESEDYVWDDIVTFGSETVLPFTQNVFPDWLEDYIDQVAQSTQTPREMSAMGAFTALSIALTGKFEVEVYDGWIEPLNTYLLTLMPPSSKKSQVFKAMMQPIQDYQLEKSDQMKTAVAQNKAEMEVKERSIHQLKNRIAQPKKGDTISELEEELKFAVEDLETADELHLPTYIVDDTTPEVLTQLLQQNNERMGIISAEGGLFSSLQGRYSDVSNYDVYLSGYSGDMMSVHRLSREAVQLESPLLSVGVYAQPSIIQDLPREFFDRGLMARFLYSLPNDNRGDRDIRPKRRDPAISEAYYNNMKSLLNIQTDGVTLSLDRQADNLLYLLQEEIEYRQGPAQDLAENDDIGAWAGKLVGQLMRLAGLIHMSKVMSHSDYTIKDDTMRTIDQLKDYFISHMKKAFDVSNADAATQNAKYLLERIEALHEDGELKRQALWQEVKKKFQRTETIDQALAVLEDRCYIKVRKISKGRGRPSQTIVMNPYFPME